jgi:hypothetical protein
LQIIAAHSITTPHSELLDSEHIQVLAYGEEHFFSFNSPVAKQLLDFVLMSAAATS